MAMCWKCLQHIQICLCNLAMQCFNDYTLIRQEYTKEYTKTKMLACSLVYCCQVRIKCSSGQVTYSDRCALVRLGGTRKQYGMCWIDGLCIWGLPLRKVATISCNSQWRSNCGKVVGVWSSFPMYGVTHLLRINCRYLLCW